MIRWFAQNGVAANLLAGVVIVAGFVFANTIKLELFPEVELQTVQVRVPYPGAAPEEVENGIVKIVEDRIRDVQGIKKITSAAAEGYGSVLAEVERAYDATAVADKIKVRVDAIDNFPEQAEAPRVEELLIRNEVISLAVHGPASERTLKELAQRIRDELNARAGLSQVEVGGVRDYEIAINVSESALREYGLSFDDVVSAVEGSSADIAGGTIKARGGEILLRTAGKAYRGEAFRSIPLLTRSDGSRVLLGDVAGVDDGFVDEPLSTRFNGERSAVLRIFATGDRGALDVAAKVRDFAGDIEGELPAGIQVTPFRDFSFYLEGRLRMLIENGLYGLMLVFAVLTLFLRPSLAFFVMLGIPISFLGALLLLPLLDITINLASLFGFILVLGIVVDDAIIVGESVFTHFQRHGGPGVEASVEGTRRVALPVTFAVLTTVVAFLPILNIPGFFGNFFFPIPVVVIACLIWSLIESKLILPYHLTLCRVGQGRRHGWLLRRQRDVANGLERFVENVYRPTLRRVLELRYLTLAGFGGVLAVMLALLAGNHMRFVFIPKVPSDYIVAQVVMPEGTSVELTRRAIDRMEASLDEVVREMKERGFRNPFQNRVVTVGAQPFEGSGGPMGDVGQAKGPHVGEVAVELVKSEDRVAGGQDEAMSAPNLAELWREKLGPVPGAQEVSFDADAAGGAGAPIDVQLAGRDFQELRSIAEKLKDKLATYEGLYDIKDNYSSGKREIRLEIKPEGQLLGVREAELGRQVRAAFYGAEAQRLQRGRDDVKVMVRYPPSERASVENLKDLRIRTPDGRAIPLPQIADYAVEPGYSTINRVNQRRVVNVTANADKTVADLERIKDRLRGDRGDGFFARWADKAGALFGEANARDRGVMERLLDGHPEVAWSLEGEAREQADIFASLKSTTLIALCIIYALLAIPLRSYVQPFIIMFVIPFGLIGAIAGHMLMFRPVSILSILGFVALAGVVVNDSLVLVDFINGERRKGRCLRQAIQNAGAIRFRPILLTSLTTFAGLVPMLFETSLQAQFLIPMAISLSFGVLFATLITLLLVPAFYFIVEDIRDILARALGLRRGDGDAESKK